MPRPLSRIAPDWWDYTTLAPELIQEAARLSVEELTRLSRPGFQVVLYAVTALFAAIKGVETALAHLQSSGTPAGAPPAATYAELCEIVDLGFHQGLDERFGRG